LEDIVRARNNQLRLRIHIEMWFGGFLIKWQFEDKLKVVDRESLKLKVTKLHSK